MLDVSSKCNLLRTAKVGVNSLFPAILPEQALQKAGIICILVREKHSWQKTAIY